MLTVCMCVFECVWGGFAYLLWKWWCAPQNPHRQSVKTLRILYKTAPERRRILPRNKIYYNIVRRLYRCIVPTAALHLYILYIRCVYMKIMEEKKILCPGNFLAIRQWLRHTTSNTHSTTSAPHTHCAEYKVGLVLNKSRHTNEMTIIKTSYSA